MYSPFVVRNTPYIVQFLYYGTVFSSSFESTVSAGQTSYMQGITGSDKLVHFVNTRFAHDGIDMTFLIYEDSVFSANGTASVTAINHNRNSVKTAEFTTYSNPPIPTSEGTLISHDRIFGSSAGKDTFSAATLATEQIELIFKKDTVYSLKMINNSTAITTVDIHWTWFESGN